METTIDPVKFTSVQEVLDFVGKEFDGGPCNAITALQTALFHQRNRKRGNILLSKKIGLELFTKALPTTVEIEGTKYTAISEVMMYAFPVLCERLLASAVYMMKDPRMEYSFQSSAVGAMQDWGEIAKISILHNSADSHKIEFTFNSVQYIAHFTREMKSGFCMSICHSSEK
jgi:hypothetical protein